MQLGAFPVALGALGSARRTLAYLVATQEPDGHWAQNQWVDGDPYWSGVQLDEAAYPILLAGALLAALGVGLGAFGAHGLRDLLGASELAWWQTAVQYQMWHAIGLVGLAAARMPRARLPAALLAAGTVVFAGSLYLMALGAPRWKVSLAVTLRAVRGGIITGVLLAVARIFGETAPLLFTSLNNQFFSTDMSKPIANLPVVIYNFALSPYEDWQRLAWGGAALIALIVLGINISARVLFRSKLPT